MILTTVSVQRGSGQVSSVTRYVPRAFGGTLVLTTQVQPTYVATGVSVQLDNVSLYVMLAAQGLIPENSYTLISLQGVPNIQRGDLLIDEGLNSWNYDTSTQSGKAEYRVSGNPEFFGFHHMEVQVTRYTGTKP